MTVNQFRRLALSLPEVAERGHMDHPDFRVGGKIFATLGYPLACPYRQREAADLNDKSPLHAHFFGTQVNSPQEVFRTWHLE